MAKSEFVANKKWPSWRLAALGQPAKVYSIILKTTACNINKKTTNALSFGTSPCCWATIPSCHRPIHPLPPPHPLQYLHCQHLLQITMALLVVPVTPLAPSAVLRGPPSMHARPILPTTAASATVPYHHHCRWAKNLHHCRLAHFSMTAAITGTSPTIRRADTSIITTGAIIKNWPAYPQRMLGSSAG